MKITNNYNLPEVFVKITEKGQRKPVEGEYSVTELINAPLIRYLKMKYWDDIEYDVSENLWALLGSAVHSYLEKHAPENSKTEESVKIGFNGVIIKGKSDIIIDDRIEDYKVVSVYSFLLGEKIEWERQLNLYNWLYDKWGYSIDKAFIHAILRDWMVSKVGEYGYPEIPFLTKEIPLWDLKDTEKYVFERTDLFKSGNIEECSEEERWMRKGKFALMEQGKKKAIKLFDTKDEFQNLKLSSKQYIEERKEQNIRCEKYCLVRKFCPYRGNNNG